MYYIFMCSPYFRSVLRLLLAHATHSHKFMTLYTKLNEDKKNMKLYVHSCSSMIYFPLRFLLLFFLFFSEMHSKFILSLILLRTLTRWLRAVQKHPMQSRVFVLHNLFFCFGSVRFDSVLFTLEDLHLAAIYFNYAHCTRISSAIISLIWFCTSFASLVCFFRTYIPLDSFRWIQ